jgi:uncharacterized surface protein with fasciclin (FAS1) repeats
MLFKTLLFTVPALVSAQNTNLQSVLSSNTNLSTFAGLLQSQPQILSSLGSATNVTILAPSNAALAAVLNSTTGGGVTSNGGYIAALLQYHFLNGVIYNSQGTSNSTFASTSLTNATYTNVTGGQRVQAVSSNGNLSFISGLLQNSTVSQAVSPCHDALVIFTNERRT